MPQDLTGRVLGHYRIKDSLGFGGMATVYRAEDINLQRDVAVKIFRPRDGMNADFLRRFEREARVLARLDHPHILPVYDYGEQDGLAFLVMPLMGGGSLRDRLQRGRFATNDAVRLVAQMLDALQYAHDRGLIHRDVKPGNMLFKSDGKLLLSDFGLVKVLSNEGEAPISTDEASLTAHAITGTPDYMAPEQIMGHAAQSSDIYAMGIVLYEMLAGERPFSADNYMSLLMKHLHEQPRPLRSLNPHIDPALETVVMRALEKDVQQRYRYALDMRAALQRAQSATPTFTQPEDTFVLPAYPAHTTPVNPTKTPPAVGNEPREQNVPAMQNTPVAREQEGASPTMLLLMIESYSGDTTHNGLWKMNIDGSGLTRLSTDSNHTQSLCLFTQYAWSNLSRDGKMYALQSLDPATATYNMYYGSLTDTTPTQFAGISNTELHLAGWTSI
jgi:serine/threonine protein kinase